jgi:hypothetical protein
MTYPCLAIVGAHGSGKSTLGSALAGALGWEFHHELGEELRLRRLARDPGAHALLAQEEFDAELMGLELARDERASGPRVVETWHPGNLAYALRRSPEVARRYRAALRGRWAAGPPEGVWVLPLAISQDTALGRLREPGPGAEATADFFWRVGQEAREQAEALGLALLPTLHTDRLDLDAALEAALLALRGAGALG